MFIIAYVSLFSDIMYGTTSIYQDDIDYTVTTRLT